MDKAEILNNFFSTQNTLDNTNAWLPNNNFDIPNTLDNITLTLFEEETVLKPLQTGTAAGPDTINNRFLKEFANSLSSPLCDLFNYSLSS